LFADRGDKANTEFPFGMRHDNDPAPLRMNEHVVRTPDPLQDPTGLFQLTDKVSAARGVYHTHMTLINKTRYQ
jgi:hypothetical protein